MNSRSNNRRFNKATSSNSFISDQQQLSEENDNVSSITGAESPPPPSSFASPRKGTKRSMQKRVVSVPIKDVEGSRLKGDSAPPSDSWAWRKYGQKPIKGSPYPRGYYRCSSSKGCPARKQVERSRLDPKMLVITYSFEHNHPWPTSRKQAAAAAATGVEAAETPTKVTKTVNQEPSTSQTETETESGMEDGFAGLTTGNSILTTADEFAWFGEMETTSSAILESPLFLDNGQNDTAGIFPMREEDESLFADLGELPECSFVFRHQRNVGPQVGIC